MLSPDYICGFVDGEGCFYILNTGRIACEFQISQKDKKILEEIKRFFGCGYIKPKYDKSGTYVYIVKNTHDLAYKIVPFFMRHNLIVKKEQFAKFAEVVSLKSKKLHLTTDGKSRVKSIKSGSSETIRRVHQYQ